MDIFTLSTEFHTLMEFFIQTHHRLMSLPWAIMTSTDLSRATQQIDLLINYRCALFHNTDRQLDDESGRRNIDEQWIKAKAQIHIHQRDSQHTKIKIDIGEIDSSLKALQCSAMRVIETAALARIPTDLQTKIKLYKLLQKSIALRCALFHYNAHTLTRTHTNAEKHFERIYFRLQQLAMYFTRQ